MRITWSEVHYNLNDNNTKWSCKNSTSLGLWVRVTYFQGISDETTRYKSTLHSEWHNKKYRDKKTIVNVGVIYFWCLSLKSDTKTHETKPDQWYSKSLLNWKYVTKVVYFTHGGVFKTFCLIISSINIVRSK